MTIYDEIVRAFMDSPAQRAYQQQAILGELAFYDWLANGDAMSDHSRRVLLGAEPQETSCGVLHVSAAAEQKGPQIGPATASEGSAGSVQASTSALPPVVSDASINE